MNIELSPKEFRRLLDLVYIGNWIINAARENDRFEDYDALESKLFGLCIENGMKTLVNLDEGVYYPSRAYEEGGIHEVIAQYEDTMFYEILAEELAMRDLAEEGRDGAKNTAELEERIDEYMQEFEQNGIGNVRVED